MDSSSQDPFTNDEQGAMQVLLTDSTNQRLRRNRSAYMKSNGMPVIKRILDDASSAVIKLGNDTNVEADVHYMAPLNKLYCSLISGLRNEMDFGLRVATILANSKEAEWISDFKFIDVLIECVDLYSCCCDDDEDEHQFMRQIDAGSGRTSRCSASKRNDDESIFKKCNCLKRFWYGMGEDKSIMDLVFGSTEKEGDDNDADVTAMEEDEDRENFDLNILDLKKHEPRNHQRIYNIIKCVTEIARNLSFNIEEQAKDNATHGSSEGSVGDETCSSGYSFNRATLNLLKFTVLLISCKDQYFQNLGLDILSNIASLVAVNSDNPQYLTFLDLINRHCIRTILSSNDINHISRCLEIISKIVSRYGDEPNEYIATQLLDHELLQRLTELLTCQHDISLVISSLELFHILSESYPKQLVDESRYLIKILLMLLNCEASQYFTKSAISRIKVIDDRPRPPELIRGSAPSQKMISSSSPAVNQTISGSNVPASSENDNFVITWLRSNFEIKPHVSSGPGSFTTNKTTGLRLNEMYEEYVKNCVRCGRKSVHTAQNFAIFVKRCFPSITMVGPIVEGLCVKTQTTPTKQGTIGPSGLSSPILKAQLSAPPKAGTPLSNGSNSASTQPTSTLIKNLLANKLRTNSGLGSSSLSSSSSTSHSPLGSFSSITAGSVTVTPATTISSSSYNSSSSSNNTTTTIIPCTLNNLNMNSNKFTQQKPVTTESSPTANNTTKAAYTNSNQSHHRTVNESNSIGSSIPTSVITSTLSMTTPSQVNSSSSPSISISCSTPGVIVTSTTFPTGTINSSTTSLSTSVTITPAITTTPLLPVSSGGPVNTQQVIVTTNPLSTSTCSTNIIQPQATCITPGQTLPAGSVLFGTTAQSGQAVSANQPQQFLLVRTMVGNQQQTGIVGIPTGGAPVRLILPPGFLTQQRPLIAQQQQSAVTVNGVASTTPALQGQQSVLIQRPSAPMTDNQANQKPAIVGGQQTNMTTTTISSTTASAPSVTSNTNDILLKAVLGSGIVSESTPPPPPPQSSPTTSPTSTCTTPVITNTVKSSPLLNVLLDKGKLPDFSTMVGNTGNQTSVANSCVTTITSVSASNSTQSLNSPLVATTSSASSSISNISTSQPTKMYILTTKSSLPIQNVSNIHQGKPITPSTVPTTTIQPQSSSLVSSKSQPVQHQIQTITIQPTQQQTPNNSEATVNNANTKTSNSNQVSITTTTAPISTLALPHKAEGSENNLQLSIPKEGLSNGEIAIKVDSVVSKTAAGPATNDLSSINDICKTVGDATKLISKRPNEDSNVIKVTKKAKTNTTINSVSITPVKGDFVKNMMIKDESTNDSDQSQPPTTIVNEESSGKTEVTLTPTPPNKSVAMTDSATNTSPPEAVNGTTSNPPTTPSAASVTTGGKTKNFIKSTGPPKVLEFICEWHGCKKSFTRPSQVYWHVHKHHVNIYNGTSEKMSCYWGGPEGRGPGCLSSRPKLSLLTHIHDFHCNPNALQQAALRRESGANVAPQPAPAAHPGYAANAALLAIRRHAINYVEYPKPPPITPLTPISVSIRLTAALILRNLAQSSNRLKSFLQTFEPYLSEICMSEGRDESRTIAQCLGAITDKHDKRKD